MGAVFVQGAVHDALMNGPEGTIEPFHGYTYAGHPAACAAGLATLDIYEKEGLLTRASEISGVWADALHALKDAPNVRDIRNLGLIGAIELETRPGASGARGHDVVKWCFDHGALVRVTGDIIVLSPPLIIETQQIEELFGILRSALESCR